MVQKNIAGSFTIISIAIITPPPHQKKICVFNDYFQPGSENRKEKNLKPTSLEPMEPVSSSGVASMVHSYLLERF